MILLEAKIQSSQLPFFKKKIVTFLPNKFSVLIWWERKKSSKTLVYVAYKQVVLNILTEHILTSHLVQLDFLQID